MASKKILILFSILIILTTFNVYFISAVCEEGQVDINNASLEDLDLIKWIGPVTAEAIVTARPFGSVDDLINVSGIGETKLQGIKDQNLACVSVEINEEPAAEEEPEENPISEEDYEKDDETDKEPELINYTAKKPSSTINKISIETINLNPKDINTENNTSKISKSYYALWGLLIFSIILISLLIFRFRRLNKNEFR